MIPLRDVIPSRTVPFVTVSIIVVNVVAFLFELSLPPAARQAFIRQYAVVPAEFTVPSAVTSMFLHGSLLHIGGNMLCLWIFGDNVEDRLGHARFLVFYLLCGAAGALAHAASAPDSLVPTIGASGAVAGVMGAYFVLYPRSRVLALVPLVFSIDIIEIPAVFFLGFWFLIQVFSGVGSIAVATGSQSGAIAFSAHVAGFAAGVLGLFVLRRRERERVEWWGR